MNDSRRGNLQVARHWGIDVLAGAFLVAVGLAGLGRAETWRSNMTGGFADVNNKSIPFIVAPKLTTGATGWAYVPTGNEVSGATLRRTTDFVTFDVRTTNGFGVPSNINFVNMVEFDNGTQKAIFTGTAQSGAGAAQLYRSADGVSFSNVVPVIAVQNKAIVGMATMGGFLYFGTSNPVSGAEIWRSSTADSGNSWTQVSTNGFGVGNTAISYLKAWEGALYAGTEDIANGGRIYRSIDGTTWNLVADSTTFGLTTNMAIATIEDFGGKLYATTWNSVTGGQMWQTTNGLVWTEVNLPGGRGFGSTANREIPQAEVAFGMFFVGTGNQQSVGAQVWRTTDVVNGPWVQSNANGWGNSNNGGAMSRGSGFFNGQLYFGSSNIVQGAEIWNVGRPKVVTNLTGLASPGTDGKIDLSWTSPDQLGAGSQFAIQYGSTNVVWSTGNAQVMLSTSGVAAGTTMTYQLSGLTMGTTYYAVVWTNNTLGWSPPTPSSASAVAPNLAAPLAPTGLSVLAAGQTAIALTWTQNTELDRQDYRLWRSTNAGVTLVSSHTVGLSYNQPPLVDNGLSFGATYYYRMTARDIVLNESPASVEVSTLTAARLRVWDGGAFTNTVSNAVNWQYDIIPSMGDSILFDGAVSTKSATWDVGNVVVKDFRMENGYSGTVNTSSSMVVMGKFNVAAGTFSFSGASMTVSGDFNQSGAGAVLLAGGTTVVFDGAATQVVSMLSGYHFSNFTVASSSRVKAGALWFVDGALSVLSGHVDLRAPGDSFTGFHTVFGLATINGGVLDIGTSSAAFKQGISLSSGAFVMPSFGGRVELGGNFSVTGGTLHVMGVNNWITSVDPGNFRYSFVLKNASINVTGMTVEFVDATGVVLDSAVVSTNIVTFNNVRYRQGAPNGAALRYNLSTGPVTFVGHDFDSTFSTNVYAPSLSTSTFLMMSGATGPNAGPAYEQDPGNGIYWGPPPVPASFAVTASSTTSLTWTWLDGADEQGYRVRRGTDNANLSGDLAPNTTQWIQNGLAVNTTYQMHVEAFNPIGIATASAITRTTLAAPPAGTYILSRGSTTITVDWLFNGNPAGFTTFEVHKATENQFSTAVVQLNGSYAGLLPNTSYYFRVRALNQFEAIPSSFDVTVGTMTLLDAVAPPAPSGLTTLPLDGRVNLSWTGVGDGDLKGYSMYRSTNAGVTAVSSQNVTNILKPGTTHADTALTNGTTFYYRVTASDTSSNESVLSNEASARPFGDATPPGTPTLTITDPGNAKISLYWSLVSDPDLQDYRIWRSTSAGVTLVSSNTVSSTPVQGYIDRGLTNGVTYYYRVTARDFSQNESVPSGENSAVPKLGQREWDGGGFTNNASEDANWSSDLSPEAGDGMIFNLVSTKSVTMDISPTGGFASMTVIGAYTGTITFNSGVVFTGPVLQSGGIVDLGSVTHNFRGSVTINGGTFNQTTGTVILDGGAQTIAMKSGTQFWGLTSTGTAIKTLGSDVAVGGDLNLGASSGYALDLGTNTMFLGGNANNNGGSGITGAVGSRVSLNGGGPGMQTVFGINSPNTDLEVNKASGTAFFGAVGPTVRNVSIAGGTVDSGGTAVFTVGGNWTQTGGVFNPFGINMTVVLSSPAAGRTVSQVAGSQFGVLKSSEAGSVLATTGITVKNPLDILNGTFEFGAGTSTVSGQARVYGGATLIVSSAVVNFSNTLGDSVVIDSAPTPGTFRLTTATPSPMVGLGRILTSSGTFESQSVNAVIRSTAPGSFIGINLSSGTVNIGGITLNGLDNFTGLTVGSSATIVAFNNLKYRNLQPGAAALRFNKNMNVASAQPEDFDISVTTNVYVTAVSSPNFINMTAATGPRAGEAYEYDPNNRVFWGLPPVPAGLTATALSTDTIRWLWNPGPDEEDYRVVRTSDSFLLVTLSSNTTFWDQTGLTPDAAQQVFIRAHNPLGNADSGSFTRATLSSTPTASAVTAVSSQTLTVSWGGNGNPGSTLYEAQLSTDVAFSSTAATLSNTVTGTATTFFGLATKTSYYFQVRSRNLDFVPSSFTAIISTRTSPESQPPVTVINVPPAGGYVISLSTIQGNASDNLSGVTSTYIQIRRNSDNNFWIGGAWSASATDLMAVLSGPPNSRTWTYDASTVTLTNGGAYNIYARSYDAEGNQESPSAVITVTADTVIPTSSVTTPTPGLRYNALTPSGTSFDAAPGVVSRVEVRIKRISDGFFWNGAGFGAGVTWNVAAGTAAWSYAGVPWVDGFQYEVSARAVDNANNTETPAVGPAFIFDTIAPAVPTGFTVTDNPGDQGTQLQLNWSANTETDVKDYRIFESTNSGVTLVSSNVVAPVTGTAFLRGGLTPVTTYYYRLTARDTAGNESGGAAEVNARPLDNVAPSSPTVNVGFPQDVPGDQGFALRLSWAPNTETDVREYGVYRSTNGSVTAGSSWTVLVTLVLSPGTTRQDSGLTNGTTYYYRIAARDNSGNESVTSSEFWAFPVDNLAPGATTLIGVQDAPGDQGFALRLSWGANTEPDLNDYRVYRSTNSGVTANSSWTVLTATIIQPGTTQQDSGLINETTYYYRVSARDVSLNEGTLSGELSAYPRDNVAPSSPTAFAVADVGLDQGVALGLSWAANTEPDLKDYRVFRSTNNDVTVGSTWTITAAVLTGTTHQETGLTPVTTYYYRLTARDVSANESPTTTMLNLRPVDNLAPATLGAPTVADAPTDQGFALRIYWTLGTDTDIREYRLYRSTNNNVTAGSSWTVSLPTLILSPGTTHQDAGLTNGTPFYYKVSARDTSGNESTPSAEASSTPFDNTPPGFPGTVTVSSVAAGAVFGQRLSLSWSAVGDPDVKDYLIRRTTFAGVGLADPVVATVLAPGVTHQDVGLTDGATFYYRISARDVSLNEGGLSSEAGAAPQDIVAPSSPAGLTVIQDVGVLRLNWGAVADIALKDYRIYRSTNGNVTVGSSWTVMAATILQPGTSHVDTALTNETTYYYMVTARDASSNESPGSTEQSGKPSNTADITPPSAPTGLSLSENIGDTNLLRLTWVASTDTGGSGLLQYRVFRGTYTSPLSSKTVVGTVAQTQTTTTDAGLTNNATYYYQVTARDAALNESAGSTEMSMYPRDLIVPAAITDLTATSQAQILLQWTAPLDNFGIVRYEIRYSSFGSINTEGVWSTSVVVGGGIPAPSSPGTTQTAVITGLYPRTMHWFAIKSFDAAGNGSTVNVPVASGAPSGSFVLAQEPAGVPGPANGSVAWGDYDNDGDLDLAVNGNDEVGYRFRVYRNDGGTFNLVQEPAGATGPGNGAVAWGDYDNDGDLDLAVNGYDGTGYRFRVYRNDGGTFVLAQEPAGPTGPAGGSVAWGDYDNDGDLDLAVNGYDGTGYRFRVYRNDGGTFNLAQEPAGATGPANDGSVAWGDYDNDGDLDLAVNGGGGTFCVYRNDGGTFVLAQQPAGAAAPAGGVAWGDYDNDGDLDLVLAGDDGTGYRFRVYRNDGGTFNLAQQLVGALGPGYAVAWGDYDNDGDLDLAVIGVEGAAGRFRVYRNDGGTFNLAQEPAGATGPGTGSVAWGDFDNDGDLDLAVNGAVGTGYRFRVYKSLEADFGNVNSTPAAPSAGFAATKSISSGTVTLKWAAGSDSGPGLTPALGLNYIVRVATAPGPGGGDKVAYKPATPFLGNYAHGYVSSSPAQLGVNFKPGAVQTTYYWQVSTVDAGLRQSPFSVEQSTYVDLQAPAVPVGLNAFDMSADQGGNVVVQWTANTESDLKDYGVYQATWAFSSGTEPGVVFMTILPPSVSVVLGGLTNGTTYYFRINAADKESNRSFTTAFSSAMPVDNLAPSSPTAVGVITPFMVSRAVDLSWAANTEADLKEYKVYRTTSTSGVVLNSSWTVKVTNILAPGATHRDAGLGAETSFYYRLTALDINGNESTLSPATTGNPAPATPGLVSVFVPPAGRYLRVSWVANSESDLKDYRIRRSTGLGDGASAPIVATILSPGTTHNDAGLTDGTTYYFTVLARDTELNHSALSTEMSGVPQDVLAPATPVGFTATDAASGGRINLTWSANTETDLKDYGVYQATWAGASPAPTPTRITAPGTTHQASGLLNGNTYYFRITARDATFNESGYSAESFAAPSSSTDANPPAVLITSPVSSKRYASLAAISGTSLDSGGGSTGVEVVEVSVQKSASNWWNGSAFGATTEYWSLASGTVTWTLPISSSSFIPGMTYLAGARAKDVAGNVSAPVYSTFTFTTRSQWLVVVPGETLVEGTPSGRSGAGSGQTAGLSFGATAYLVDASTYVVYDAADTVTPTTNDPFDVEPGTASVVNGQRGFAFTLVTGGPGATITASGSGYAAHTSTPIVVSSSSPVKLQLLVPGESPLPGSPSGKIGAPTAQTAGAAFNVTANLVDSYWNPVSGAPIVAIQTSDPYDTEPTSQSLIAGTKTFSVTLLTAGSVAITASDVDGIPPLYTAQGATVTVNPGIPTKLLATVPGETYAPGSPTGKTGSPTGAVQRSSFTVTVRAVDNYWNLISTTPTVNFTTSDPGDSHPAPQGLVGGVANFTVAFMTTGSWTITAADAAAGLAPYTSPGITTVDGLPPSAITDLNAVPAASTEGGVTLTWTAPGDDGTVGTATVYRVRYKTGGTIANDTDWGGATVFAPSTVPAVYGTIQSVTVTGLIPGTTYWFDVRGEDEVPNLAAHSNSPGAAAQNFTPASPVGLTTLDKPGDQGGAVGLSWTANTEPDLQHYRVYRSTNSGVVIGSSWTVLVGSVVAPGTTHLDAGLVNGTTYYYRIAALDLTNPGYLSPASASEASAIPYDNLVPAAPTGLGTQDASTGSTLNLSWTANADPDIKDYRIYRTTGLPGVAIAVPYLRTAILSPGTTHREFGLTDGTTYYYRLTARDINLQESVGSAEVSGTPSILDTAPPATITNLSALTGSGEGAVSLTWTAPSDNVAVVSYLLRGSKAPIVTQGDFIAAAYQQTLGSPLATGTTESRTATVTAGITWYFAVEAVDAAGNVAALPTVAVAVSSNPNAPSAPAGLAVVDARLGGKVGLTWTANTEPDAVLYAVWRGTYTGFPDSKGVFLSSVTHPTAVYADANLVNGSTYFYHVYAVDLGGLRSLAPSEATGMPTGAATLTVSGLPTPYTAGARADLVVAARAGDGSLSASYTGTVRFTAPGDPAAVLPGLYTFTSGYAGADAGLHIFKAGVILNTEGTQSVSVEDVANPSVAGKQTVTVIALGSIKGLVTRGSTKQPITGVLVAVKSLDTGSEFSATSLTDGTYEIKNLNKGRYKVTASWSEGGVTTSVWLESNAGESDRNFTLETKNGLGTVAGSVGSLVSASAKAGTARVIGLSPALAAQALAEDPTLPKVEVCLAGGRTVATVPVNPSGRFEIPNLLTESYEVRAWTGGAWSEPKRVSVIEGQTLSVDFEALGFVPGLASVGPNPAVNGQAPSLWFYADWPSWEAKVSILDASGAPVCEGGSGGGTGFSIEKEAGRAMAPARAFTHRAVWSGSNAEGRAVASGVYLMRLEVTNPETGETRSVVRKAVVIR